jgi:hypothetical protein
MQSGSPLWQRGSTLCGIEKESAVHQFNSRPPLCLPVRVFTAAPKFDGASAVIAERKREIVFRSWGLQRRCHCALSVLLNDRLAQSSVDGCLKTLAQALI